MNRSYLIFIFWIFFLPAKSQNMIGKSFVTNVENIKVYPVDSITGRYFYYVHRNTKFTVTGIDKNNNLIITFWEYKGHNNKIDSGKIPSPNVLSKDLKDFSFVEIRNGKIPGGPHVEEYISDEIIYALDNYLDPEYIGEWAGNRSFIMPLTSFNQQTQAYFGKSNTFNWGVMTLPVKLRFGNSSERFFNFEEKINLGFSAGIKRQFQNRKDVSINYLGGVGIASAKTDSVSLKQGFYDSKHLSEIAFSFNFGVLYQYETFQIGVFIGKDYFSSVLGRQWRYQGKTWLGFAIGVSLFAKPTATTGTVKN